MIINAFYLWQHVYADEREVSCGGSDGALSAFDVYYLAMHCVVEATEFLLYSHRFA